MASLTLPTRPPYINTFEELLDQEDITITGNAHNSFMSYLNQTKDSIMMVQIYGILLATKEYQLKKFISMLCELAPADQATQKSLFEVLCTPRIIILSLQELNKRMLRQGFNETHLYKPDYPTRTHKVIFSPTPVVRLQELLGAKLYNDIRWSTASGQLNI